MEEKSTTKKLPKVYWISIFYEFIERGAYYGAMSILSVYLVASVANGGLGCSKMEAGILKATIQPIIYALPIICGAIADRFGYRKTLNVAFLLLGIGYISASQAKTYPLFFTSLIILSLGAGAFKPVINGTIARVTDSETSSIGFGIYYWSINLGAFLFPLIVVPLMRNSFGLNYVFLVSGIAILLMLIPNKFLYKEPPKPETSKDISQVFVDAVSSIATNFKMSKMMIALTVAAFGTCAPELAISFNSITSNAGDIALANVLGSNVVNILLVIGTAAIARPIKVKNEVIKKELPILILITSMFALCIMSHYIGRRFSDFTLSRQDGIIFLCFFTMFIFYIISVVKAKQGILERATAKYSTKKSIIYTIICCILIIIASDMVVDNAKSLATMLHLSTKIVTMTVVVIGTSLPEMTMTVIAAKKGEFDIAIGNIIGTNIFNIGIVLGLPLLIFGGFTTTSFSLIDVLFVHIAAYSLYYFAKNDKVLSKLEGIIMVAIFIIYYTYLFIA